MSQRQFGASNGGPVDLSDTDLSGAALRYATLSGADFTRATLIAADLVHSRLDGADLTAADLTDSIFDYADLAGARLDGAIVVGASFANARNLTAEQIAAAHGDASTVLPAALMPPESWFPQLDDDFYREYVVPDRQQLEDLYEVLGVVPSAKPDEIRSSYRNLVKKYHPDLNPDDAAAQETFKQVSTAYRILSDPEKRARYDRGEIGHDGEISPEFAAKKQFRRYAFRFYAAAGMSLLLAGSVLGVVWHSVLDDDRGRVAIAVATPPKSIERLDGGPWSDSASRGTPLRPQTEVRSPQSKLPASAGSHLEASPPEPDSGEEAMSEPAVDAAAGTAPDDGPPAEDAGGEQAQDTQSGEQAQEPQSGDGDHAQAPSATAPGHGQAAPDEEPVFPTTFLSRAEEAEKTENAEQKQASLSGAPDAGQASPPGGPDPAAPVQPAAPPGGEKQASVGGAETQPAASPGQGGTARPLGEDHSDKEARPAQADAAGTSTPAALPAQPAAQGEPPLRAKAVWRDALGRVRMRGGRTARDTVSDLFRARAIKTALGEDRSQSTASVDPLAPRERPEDQEEIWDLYTHSLPEEQAGEDRPWPAALKPQPGKPALPAHKIPHVIAKAPEKPPSAQIAQEQQPGRQVRRQAISEILAGGL